MNSESVFDAAAYDMAVDIKQLTGAIDYLDGMKNTLTQRVLAYDTLPTIRPLRNGHRVEVVARRAND